MGLRKIYRTPEETARHKQLKRLCLEYFQQYEKLMKRPSMLNASRTRKACVELKKVAHARGLELLELYAPTKNGERMPLYGKQKEKHNG